MNKGLLLAITVALLSITLVSAIQIILPSQTVFQNLRGEELVNITVSGDNLSLIWWSIDNATTNNSIDSPYDVNISGWVIGSYSLWIFANDTSGNLASFIYNFTVNNRPNISYYYPSESSVSVAENSFISFNHSSTDIDGDDLSYSWLLDGSIQSTSQNWTYSPGFFESGIHNITIEVSDGLLVESQYWNLTVNNTNRVPVWNMTFQNFTIAENSEFSYNISANDSDNEVIRYYVNDSGFSISSQGRITASIYSWFGARHLKMLAGDGYENITATIIVNVTPDGPQITVTYPINNSILVFNDTANVVLNVTLLDDNGCTANISIRSYEETITPARYVIVAPDGSNGTSVVNGETFGFDGNFSTSLNMSMSDSYRDIYENITIPVGKTMYNASWYTYYAYCSTGSGGCFVKCYNGSGWSILSSEAANVNQYFDLPSSCYADRSILSIQTGKPFEHV